MKDQWGRWAPVIHSVQEGSRALPHGPSAGVRLGLTPPREGLMGPSSRAHAEPPPLVLPLALDRVWAQGQGRELGGREEPCGVGP